MMNEPFKSYELKQLKLFYKLFHGDIPEFKQFKKELHKYGYTDEVELTNLYTLYANNYVEDGNFESIEVPDRGLPKLVRAITTIIKNKNMDYDDAIKMFTNPSVLGSWFSSTPSRSWGSPSNPYIDVDSEGIELYLPNEDWEKYFSGLDENDLWYYHRAFDNYSNYYEEMDSDEFNYVRNLPNELIEKISTLSEMVGDFNFANKIKKGTEDEGELREFLETYFPDKVESIIDDYVTEVGYAVGRARSESVKQCYDDDVIYTAKGSADIFIPWKSLLDIVNSNPSIITLSNLKDAEINGEMYLESCWYDAYPTMEEYKDAYDSIENHIDKLIEDLEDEDNFKDVTNRIEISKKMWSLISKLGFEKKDKYFTKKTNDGVTINILQFEIEKGKIKLEVIYPKKIKSKWSDKNKEVIEIPFEQLSDWVNSLPLDRQVESIKRIIKKLLYEGKLDSKLLDKYKPAIYSQLDGLIKNIGVWVDEDMNYDVYISLDDNPEWDGWNSFPLPNFNRLAKHNVNSYNKFIKMTCNVLYSIINDGEPSDYFDVVKKYIDDRIEEKLSIIDTSKPETWY